MCLYKNDVILIEKSPNHFIFFFFISGFKTFSKFIFTIIFSLLFISCSEKHLQKDTLPLALQRMLDEVISDYKAPGGGKYHFDTERSSCLGKSADFGKFADRGCV